MRGDCSFLPDAKACMCLFASFRRFRGRGWMPGRFSSCAWDWQDTALLLNCLGKSNPLSCVVLYSVGEFSVFTLSALFTAVEGVCGVIKSSPSCAPTLRILLLTKVLLTQFDFPSVDTVLRFVLSKIFTRRVLL